MWPFCFKAHIKSINFYSSERQDIQARFTTICLGTHIGLMLEKLTLLLIDLACNNSVNNSSTTKQIANLLLVRLQFSFRTAGRSAKIPLNDHPVPAARAHQITIPGNTSNTERVTRQVEQTRLRTNVPDVK